MTRASRKKEADAEPDASPAQSSIAPALRKVFFFSEEMLSNSSGLQLERFYHPGHSKQALFLTHTESKQVMEVIEFDEVRRSWLIENNVSSNGRIFFTVPFDVTFLALHHIRKHCGKQALPIDQVFDAEDKSALRLLTEFVSADNLLCIADVIKIPSEKDVFYRYNAKKTLAWLALKTRIAAKALRTADVYCGQSGGSLVYQKTLTPEKESKKEVDALRVAYGVVGDYIDVDLQEKLRQYLSIPEEEGIPAKRKSQNSLKSQENKKIKLEKKHDSSFGENGKLNSSLIDKDSSMEVASPDYKYVAPLKERTLTAKEKALAKGAKGTKSIASFFKK